MIEIIIVCAIIGAIIAGIMGAKRSGSTNNSSQAEKQKMTPNNSNSSKETESEAPVEPGLYVGAYETRIEPTEDKIIETMNSIDWSDKEIQFVDLVKDSGTSIDTLDVSGSLDPDTGLSAMLLRGKPDFADYWDSEQFFIEKAPETVQEMTDMLLSFLKYGDNPKIIGEDLIWNQKEYDNRVTDGKERALMKRLIDKYGEKFGKAIMNSEVLVDMPKKAVIEILGEGYEADDGNWYFGQPFDRCIIMKANKVVEDKELSDGLWLDMTKDLLISSYGEPENEKREVSKSGTKLKWYYGGRTTRQRTTAYRLEVRLENDLVVSWKELE